MRRRFINTLLLVLIAFGVDSCNISYAKFHQRWADRDAAESRHIWHGRMETLQKGMPGDSNEYGFVLEACEVLSRKPRCESMEPFMRRTGVRENFKRVAGKEATRWINNLALAPDSLAEDVSLRLEAHVAGEVHWIAWQLKDDAMLASLRSAQRKLAEARIRHQVATLRSKSSDSGFVALHLACLKLDAESLGKKPSDYLPKFRQMSSKFEKLDSSSCISPQNQRERRMYYM